MKQIQKFPIYILTLITVFFISPTFGQENLVNTVDSTTSRSSFIFPIVQNEIDSFDGSTRITASRLENWVLDKLNESASGIDIAVGKINDLYILYYYGVHNCLVQGESKISLLLENKEVVELSYYGDIDCKSTVRKAKFIFVEPKSLNNSLSLDDLADLQEKNIKKIFSSPIEKVRISTTKGYSDYHSYEVLEYIENIRMWKENNINNARDDFEKSFDKKKYTEYNEKYQNEELGAVYYKIPYDYSLSLSMEDMESYTRTYLKTYLDDFDESINLKNYYGYFRGNTKFALMDMIKAIQNVSRD